MDWCQEKCVRETFLYSRRTLLAIPMRSIVLDSEIEAVWSLCYYSGYCDTFDQSCDKPLPLDDVICENTRHSLAFMRNRNLFLSNKKVHCFTKIDSKSHLGLWLDVLVPGFDSMFSWSLSKYIQLVSCLRMISRAMCFDEQWDRFNCLLWTKCWNYEREGEEGRGREGGGEGGRGTRRDERERGDQTVRERLFSQIRALLNIVHLGLFHVRIPELSNISHKR